MTINLYQLTPKQLEVLSFMAQGMNNAQIADNMFISVKTVHRHIRDIFSKLEEYIGGCHRRVKAVLYYLEIQEVNK